MVDQNTEPSVDYTEAMKARLVAETGFPVCVGEARPADLKYPYLVIWASPTIRLTTRLAGNGREGVNRFQITAVGLSEDDCIGAADRATEALHLWRPNVEGRRGRFEQEEQGGGSAVRPLVDPEVRGPEGQTVYSVPVFLALQSSARS